MADCRYTVPDLTASGDALYGPRICRQPFVDWAWTEHGFNYDWWQKGWGFDDVCNARKPLARCLSAIWLLSYSAEDYQNEAWNTDALHWGGRYVREQFKYYDDLRRIAATAVRMPGRRDASGRASGISGAVRQAMWKPRRNAAPGIGSLPGSVSSGPR